MKGELPMNDVVKIVEDFIRPHIPQPFELFAVEWEKFGGDMMLSINGQKIEITNIEYKKYDEPIKTYNLTVEGNSNYFVTDIQVLVHNAGSMH